MMCSAGVVFSQCECKFAVGKGAGFRVSHVAVEAIQNARREDVIV